MPKLDISIRPSKLFVLFNLLINLISVFIIIKLPILILIKFCLILLSISYSIFIIYKNNLLKNIIHDDQGWKMVIGNKKNFDIEILGDSTITQFLSIVRYKIIGKHKKFAYVICKDSMNKDNYRKWMVRIRFYR